MIRIFNHWVRRPTFAKMTLDVGFAALVTSMVVSQNRNGAALNLSLIASYLAILALTALVFNFWLGTYFRRGKKNDAAVDRGRAVLAIYLAVPVAYLIFSAFPGVELKQSLLAISGVAAGFGLLTHQLISSRNSMTSALQRQILIFGVGSKALQVMETLNRSDPSAEIVGFYPGPNEEVVKVPRNEVLSSSRSLIDTVRDLNLSEIVVAVTERRGGALPLRELLDCRLHGVRVFDLASHFEQTMGQIRLDALYAGWLIFGDGFAQGFQRTLIKRVFDIVCAIILLVLACPVMILTTLAIAFESGFPILYRQERVGLNGQIFNVIKFRSMRADAEKDGKPRWAIAGDNRVTRVGRVIRKLRIDELPQLFSVLKGDMSLVGPRPERPFFVDQLTNKIPFYAVRHSVKPGVTGWAQVRYPYGASVEDAAEKLQYDLYYVKNHTLFLDVVVLFETVWVVLTARGAQ
ncbi:MAG: TIGR03013 family XrtA/PEP-CTERM system glycosyltransferase [Betaproteobacteria bacterium]